MYKIMLADDEGIVIDSLTYIIRQNFGEQCEIASAKTGRSVIELAESFRPDIAFMDIQMPGINGIEAMKEIRKNNESVIFIVMSAYDKFDYAKEAINLGVLDYLNKPVNQKKIAAVLQKAMDLIDARREKRSKDLEIREKLEIVVPMIEQGFIMAGLLQEGETSGVDNYRQLLGMTEENIFTLVLEFGEEIHDRTMTNPVGTGVRLQIFYAKICDTIRDYYHCCIGPLMTNQLVCCVPTEMEEGDYDSRVRDVEKCRQLQKKISEITGFSCRIGIGSVLPPEKMAESYRDAQKALETAKGSVAHCRDLPVFCEYEPDYPLHLENRLFDCIKAGKIQEAKEAARVYFAWMEETQKEYEESIRLKTLEFVLFMDHVAFRNGGLVYRFRDRAEYLGLVETEELGKVRTWFIQKAEAAARNVAGQKKEYSNEAIEKAQEYIQHNYRKDLSLEEMSRQMDMSPYYFSKLFKEVSGSNFVEYVTGVRIKRARELLLDGSKSIKQICGEIGYSDPNYFSRIFKKYEGCTPTEFREGKR